MLIVTETLYELYARHVRYNREQNKCLYLDKYYNLGAETDSKQINYIMCCKMKKVWTTENIAFWHNYTRHLFSNCSVPNQFTVLTETLRT